jgi:hypothetical protein
MIRLGKKYSTMFLFNYLFLWKQLGWLKYLTETYMNSVLEIQC